MFTPADSLQLSVADYMRLLSIKVPRDRGSLVLNCLQDECKLKNVTLQMQADGKVAFVEAFIHDMESGPVLHELDKIGCGVAYGKISMLPIQLSKPLPKDDSRYLASLVKSTGLHVKGRLAIEEMYDSISGGCSLTFDFCCMVILAAWIAAVGLATNNAVMIVASMLVSPLMGPILAFCFALAVRDWILLKRAFITELVGGGLTLFWGFISGLVAAAWPNVALANNWPTQQMMSRGDPGGLIAGALFAVPSGAIVGLCACAGGPTAIVGVAIAASLLPPLVNSGMTLAFAIAGTARYDDPSHHDANVYYSICGISAALYGINVIIIMGVCLFFFWVKRVFVPVRKQLSSYRDLPPAVYPSEEPEVSSAKGHKVTLQPAVDTASESSHTFLDASALDLIVKEVASKWKLKQSVE